MVTRHRARILGGLVALAALAVGAAFIRLSETRRVDAMREASLDVATTHAYRLEGELRGALAAAEVLAVAVRQTGRAEGLDALAAALLGARQSIGTLQLAPKGTVTLVYPATAAGGALGRNLLTDPVTHTSATDAMQSREARVLAPVALLQQRAATVLGEVPVFLSGDAGGNRFWGFVVVTIGLADLVHASQLDDLPTRGYHFWLSTMGPTSRRPTVVARSTEEELREPVRGEIRLPGDLTWTLSVVPRGGWRSSSLLATEIVLVAIAALLVGLSTHRLLREPEVLREEVAVRRRRLSEAQHQLHLEVTQRRQAEERLHFEATHDPLSALPNRFSFLDQVQGALEFTRREPGVRIAVLFLDLDRFKYVNDSLGHTLGDDLLVAVAERLRLCLREGDVIARVGGDEFAVLLGAIEDMGTVRAVADRLLKALELPFAIGAQEVFTTASIGITISSTDYERAEDLLRDADTATHRAKSEGRARHQLFDATMRTRVVRTLELETDLRRAIERDEFLVHYQPIIALGSGEISGCEALVRWQHPVRGFVSPGEFIPLAEETGLVVWIDRWVLRTACRQLAGWLRAHPEQPLTVSVNLSGRQLGQPHLVEHVAETLKAAELDPASLKLEVTESAVMDNVNAAIEILQRLRNMGVGLLVDDFGTGYSSLSYLERFPFQGVKIDRAFVKGLDRNERDRDIVRAIVTLADSVGMHTIAEGIETAEQLEELRKVGCGYGQGYWFSKPVEPDALERLLALRPRW